jgi:hypothetical protein
MVLGAGDNNYNNDDTSVPVTKPAAIISSISSRGSRNNWKRIIK